MKKMKLTGLMLAVLALLAFAGCAKNEIDGAIELLGGTDTDRQEAEDIISMSVKDPLPRLIAAMKKKDLSAKTRANVAAVIGGTCERQGDGMEVSPIPVFMEVLGGSEAEVKKAIVDAMGRIPGKESLKALQSLLDDSDKDVAGQAWNILDSRARELEAKANALSNDALDRKIELTAEAVAVNPRNQELAQKLAAFYVVKGDMDKAREVFNSGGEFVSAVKVIGPVPKDVSIDPAGFDTSKPVALNDGGELAWFDFTDVPGNGAIDFRKSRKTKISKSIFYAAFNIESKSDMDVLLKFQCPRSQVVIWAGGEEIYSADPQKDEQEIALSLKKGTTPVLVKLRSKKYARFSARIADKNHLRVDSIGYSL